MLRALGDSYGKVLGEERRILREALGSAGGQEIDTQGDAFFFSFARARDAVAGAVGAQRALAEHDWPDDVEVKVRMGLHTGEPAVGDQGYVGLDVVRAARICSAGEGGQILISETTRALLGGDLPDGVELRDLGAHDLKDIGDERLYQLAVDGQEAALAPLKTEDRGGIPSKADILGDDFEQRIAEFVKQSISGKFPAAPPPAPPPSKSLWSRLSGRRGRPERPPSS